MQFTGVVGFALGVAPMLAGGGFGRSRRGQVRLGGLGHLAFVIDRHAGSNEFAVDVGEAAALGETARGAGRRVGVGGKAVPAPEVAVARDEALAGLEQVCEACAVGALDHADLGKAARKLRRRLHELGKSQIGRASCRERVCNGV